MFDKWSKKERRNQARLRQKLQKINAIDRYSDVKEARFSWRGRFRVVQLLRGGGELWSSQTREYGGKVK